MGLMKELALQRRMNGRRGLTIGLRDVRSRFDGTSKLLKAVDAATARVLGRFGGRVRKRAVQSQPVRESGASAAGQPPYAHAVAKIRASNRRRKKEGLPPKLGFKGLRHILYDYDPGKKTVIVGPVSNRRRALTIAQILEYGDDPKGKVAARPFMRPALAAEQAGLSALWAGSIKP